jgi:hypothetical protein
LLFSVGGSFFSRLKWSRSVGLERGARSAFAFYRAQAGFLEPRPDLGTGLPIHLCCRASSLVQGASVLWFAAVCRAVMVVSLPSTVAVAMARIATAARSIEDSLLKGLSSLRTSSEFEHMLIDRLCLDASLDAELARMRKRKKEPDLELKRNGFDSACARRHERRLEGGKKNCALSQASSSNPHRDRCAHNWNR